MNFILNMAWREMRASWHRLLLFFLCIAIGVGSIVALRSLVQNLKAAVTNEVRSFYGADVRTWQNQPWPAELRAVHERLANSPLVVAQTEIIETQTMARAADDAFALPFMIQVRAVQERFPLYGAVKLTDGMQGVSIGVFVTLLFALPPLLEIRQVKPILVLRQDAAGRRRFDRMRLLAAWVMDQPGENTEQTEITKQTEPDSQVSRSFPSIPLFPSVPYSLLLPF